MKTFIKSYSHEIIGALVCISIAMLSSYSLPTGDSQWYAHLIKPSFNPPNWLFGPVWTILYGMMGVAFGKLMRNQSQNKALISLFVLQFAANLLWSWLFFYFHRIDLALFDIIILWLLILTFMIVARKKPAVFLLFVPYITWVSFALLLNASIFILNKF